MWNGLEIAGTFCEAKNKFEWCSMSAMTPDAQGEARYYVASPKAQPFYIFAASCSSAYFFTASCFTRTCFKGSFSARFDYANLKMHNLSKSSQILCILFGGSRSKKEDQFHSASFGDLCKWPFNIHTVVFMYIGTMCITHIKSKIKYLGSISQSVILRFAQVAFGTSNTWILAFFCTHVAVAAQKLLHKYLCLCLYLRLSL